MYRGIFENIGLGFPKIRGTILGVLIKRLTVLWVILGSSYFRKYHMPQWKVPSHSGFSVSSGVVQGVKEKASGIMCCKDPGPTRHQLMLGRLFFGRVLNP